jgi:ATP-dependent RNA helicase MSS116
MVKKTAAKATADPSLAASSAGEKHHSDLRFSDIKGLCPESKRAVIKGFGYEFATDGQKMTIEPALDGKDLLVRARTGTGKTLGFLLPTIEQIKNAPCARHKIRALVVAPTRELALQIAKEAEVVLREHKSLCVHAVVGGTNKNSEAKRVLSNVCSILVCTPGRYLDHINTTAGFSALVDTVSVLVLDECDRLLDMGFKKQIAELLATLPDRSKRQTLLFSATLPSSLKDIAGYALRENYKYVDCVGKKEPETAQLADQAYVTVHKAEWIFRLAQVGSLAGVALLEGHACCKPFNIFLLC